MGKQRIPASLFVLGASIFLSLASLIALLIALPAQMDAASKAREQRLVGNGVHGIISEVAAQVVPQTSWDDAVANLDNTFDRAWAADNIGKFFFAADGFDYSAVIDAADHPLFFSDKGAPARLKDAQNV
ncbi:MAG: CHASE4 domain-containing protein, partial [Caulobacterales bacterium]